MTYTVTIAYIEHNEHGAFARYVHETGLVWRTIDDLVRSLRVPPYEILSVVAVNER